MTDVFDGFQFTSISAVLFMVTAISITVASLLWRRRNAVGAITLIGFELAAAIWAFGEAFDYAATTVEGKLFWSSIAYVGTSFAPLLFHVFAFQYADQTRHFSRNRFLLLAVIPFITLLLALSNPLHHLIWSSVTLSTSSNLGVFEYGPWFWVFTVHAWILLLTGIAALIRAMLLFPVKYRKHMASLLIAVMVPFAGNILYLSGQNPVPGLDWTPVGLAFTGLVLGWNFMSFRMFTAVPLARDHLLENMSEAVFVLDPEDQLVDLNLAASRLLNTSERQLDGWDLARLVVSFPELGDALGDLDLGEADFFVGDGEDRRAFHLNTTEIDDNRGRKLCRLLVLRDITDRKKLEDKQNKLVNKLRVTLREVKTLSGLLPICAWCKKIRDDEGYWNNVDEYLGKHSQAQLSHGICPECLSKQYGVLFDEDEELDI